jgi:undecaprenyl-diphosphatase
MLHFYILIITQIITESLPISSSGHQRLASCLMSYFYPNSQISPLIFSDAISYFLNMPTVFIVPIFFFTRWWPIIKEWRRSWPLIIRIAFYAWVAAAITAIIFLSVRSYSQQVPLWVGFGLTSIALFSLYFCPESGNKKFSLGYAMLLGLLQGCAVLPGLSRFGLVYVSARWFGFDTQKAFEITWLIQWPLLVGASGVSMLMLYTHDELALMISGKVIFIMAAAACISYWCLTIVYRMALAHVLWWIGFYMILPLLVSYYCLI